jgi:hypothetical protein
MGRVLAEVTMVAHFAYLAFVVFGGFLAWRWPRVILAHLFAVGVGGAIIVAGANCPLTYLEDQLRRSAGGPGLPRGFVDGYIEGVLYPERYAGQVQVLVGAVIVVSWIGAYLMARRARRRSSPPVLSHVD